jgi:DNA-binding CsgD family transcriptional regulator
MSLILPERHIALNSSNEMEQICLPLKPFDLNHIVYVKVFKDGSHINLCNHSEWTKYFYEQSCYKVALFEGGPELYESGQILWHTLADQNIFRDARNYFKIDHGITIISKQKDTCDFFYIGSTSNKPQLINFYLNHFDILERFMLYFKERARPLIEKATKHKIRLYRSDPNLKTELANIYYQPSLSSDLQKQFLKNTKVRHYQLDTKYPCTISQRELDCLVHLFQGKSAAEAGNDLFISRRTVEKHIENLKKKLDCQKRSDILKKLVAAGFQFHGQERWAKT